MNTCGPHTTRRGFPQRWRAPLVALAAILALTTLILPPPPAVAHPLGNFTTNRYSRVEVSPGQVRVRYVLDLAEIPTLQAMASLDAGSDGQVSEAEREAYATRRLAEISRHLQLTVDGRELPLRPTAHEVELLPGQAGLQTLRLSAWLEAPEAAAALSGLHAAGVTLEFRDRNEPEKLGWREIVVGAADGVSLGPAPGAGQVPPPARDVSDELRVYADDLLASPLDVRQVRFSVVPGDTAAPAADPGPAARGGALAAPRASDAFADLLARAAATPARPLSALAALLSALLLGAMHALSPGHGKTIVGAYLAGSRGTARHALFLGLVVTVVHTAGVFALGLATLFASRYVVPERVYPWLSLVSGVLVFGLGVSLVRARWPSARRAAGVHHHGAAGHSHGWGSHSHVILGTDGAPITWRSLLALGVSGGLLPCPSALVVMLGAIALHQVAFGLVLILAFSAGLGSTLVALGLVVVSFGQLGRRLSRRRSLAWLAGGPSGSRWTPLGRIVRLLPATSAAVVAGAGLLLSAEAAQIGRAHV
jgi:nickel/cobalt exporter